MKKVIAKIAIFLACFVIVYLILCFLPSMRIKLAAEPAVYFIESIKHNMGFKVTMALGIGLIVTGLSFFIKRKKYN